MHKPPYFDETQGFGEFERLELGGHICKILRVEESQSRAGRDMVNIYLDIAEGDQKGYFMRSFENDTRENKKYGCIVYQVVVDDQGNTSKGFKTFVDAVEKSNPGFDKDAIWNDDFAGYFKNKLIGGVFGREQYINRQGEPRWATKCVQFRDVETVRKGVDVPEDKYLTGQNAKPGVHDFSVVDSGDDLPF